MARVRKKGDLKAVAKLPKALKVAFKSIEVETAKGFVPEVSNLLSAAFASGTTAMGGSRPMGKTGPVSLVQSGALQASLRFKRRGGQATVKLPDYARYLFKFGILPPKGVKPPEWMSAIEAAAKTALSDAASSVPYGGTPVAG